jgi:CubicO group peptidase (beta-lactamase class C family)
MRLLILALLLTAGWPSSVLGETRAAELDAMLREAVRDGVVVGAQAYVGRGGDVLLDGVYGRVRPDRDADVDPETLFCIGSVSKPLASAIALGLAEEGKIELGAPVNRYLPAFEALPWAPTIRELLAHRGGIYTQRRKLSENQVRWIRDFRLTLAEAADGIAGEELIAEPGSLFAYSGAGYCALGRAVEVAAGADIETLLQQRLGGPLGWERTSYFPSPEDSNVAAGADAEGAAHPGTPHLLGADHRLALVGGSVYSTARELARFARAMAAGGAPVLSAGAFERVVERPFAGQAYGYGWTLRIPEGSERATGLSHNGALAASRAALTVDLETGEYAVVLYSVAGRPGEAEKRVREALED